MMEMCQEKRDGRKSTGYKLGHIRSDRRFFANLTSQMIKGGWDYKISHLDLSFLIYHLHHYRLIARFIGLKTSFNYQRKDGHGGNSSCVNSSRKIIL